MQGQRVEPEVLNNLNEISKNAKSFDCVVIIRGGGGKVDLSDFDNLNIAKKIAEMKLPVITGIGHDIDQSITDLVAHTALKTPTAVAEFIIQRNLMFESSIIQLGRQISDNVLYALQKNSELLEHASQTLNWSSASAISKANNLLSLIESNLPLIINNQIQIKLNTLNNIEQLLQQLSPEAHFKRGYSIVEKNGKKLSNKNKPKIGEEVNIFSIIGKLTSKITNIS
jgi:exodeoxyribonuclease VII large subunit